MRYDSDHKDRTKERLLKEAASAIRADGPDRVGVAAIMAKAGLTHGGFYAHFKSKNDLIEQAIGQMFDSAARRYETTTKDLDPGAALAAYLDFYLSRSHRDAPQRGCPLPALSGDLARMPAAARKRFTAGAQQVTARIGSAGPRQIGGIRSCRNGRCRRARACDVRPRTLRRNSRRVARSAAGTLRTRLISRASARGRRRSARRQCGRRAMSGMQSLRAASPCRRDA